MDEIDPAAARDALAAARQQRKNVVGATSTPWWVWVLGLLALFAVLAARDFLPDGADGLVSLGAVLVLAAAVFAPRLWPRTAGASALVHPHPSAIPAWVRVATFVLAGLAFVVAARGGQIVAHALTRAGAPPWLVEHPHAVSAAVVVVVVGGVGWLVDRAIRARFSR